MATFTPRISKSPGIDNSQIGKAMQLAKQKLQRDPRYTYFVPRSSPVSAALAGGASVGTAAATNVLGFSNEGVLLEQYNIGTLTKFVPDMTTAGLNIVLGEGAAEGGEYGFGITASSLHAKTIGTDPAFFIRAQLYNTDVSDCTTLVVGFRKAAAYSSTTLLSDPYTDIAALGITASAATADIKIYTRLNSGTAVNTDTTQDWADATSKYLTVVVSKSGAVSFFVNDTQVLASSAFVFDSTDVVVPFVRFLGSASADPIILQSLEIGPVQFT